MIIFASCGIVLFVATVWFRGRIGRLLSLRFRRMYLVWIALLDQVLVISVLPDHAHAVLATANLLSYVVAGFFLWSNRKIAAVPLLGVGGTLNVVTIVANGGTMPASAAALKSAGWRTQPGHFVNSGIVAHPKLAVLGDNFGTPSWFPVHGVFSVGDIIVVVAFALLVYGTCTAEAGPIPRFQEASVCIPTASRSCVSGMNWTYEWECPDQSHSPLVGLGEQPLVPELVGDELGIVFKELSEASAAF